MFSFLEETLTVVVGIVIADTLMSKQRRDDVVAYVKDATLTLRAKVTS